MHAHRKGQHKNGDQEEVNKDAWSNATQCIHNYDPRIEERIVCKVLINTERVKETANREAVFVHLLNYYVLLERYEFV